MVQITLLTNDNYGPWTHTLGIDREYKVQMCQSSFYETIQHMFSNYGGLVFPNRFDEFFIVSNGISYSLHLEIKTKLQNLFPFEISMAISDSKYPFLASKQAHMAKISTDHIHQIYGEIKKEALTDRVHLIHLDIEGITEKRKRFSPYEIALLVQATHQIISNYCYDHKLLGFFMGGDNFVIVSDDVPQIHSKNLADLIQKNLNVVVNCGIGNEKTARVSMAIATKNLDGIRMLRRFSDDYPRILTRKTSTDAFSHLFTTNPGQK